MRELWPDKLLYACIMLFVTGLVGILFGGLQAVADVSFSSNIPQGLLLVPAWASILLSAAASLLAFKALQERNTNWAIAGGVAGVLSFGMLGAGSALSVAALAYVGLARREQEDLKRASLALTEDMWPDKCLAASLVLVILGAVSAVWAALLLGAGMRFDLAPPSVVGQASLVVAALCLAAAWMLYHQRGLWLGVAAALGGLLTLGLFIIGPILAIGALVLLSMARAEDEFERPARGKARAAGAAGSRR